VQERRPALTDEERGHLSSTPRHTAAKVASACTLLVTALLGLSVGARGTLDADLMEATVKIEGRKRDSLGCIGTGFFVGLPVEGKKHDTMAVVLLVTARHVFDSIGEDSANIIMRMRLSDGSFRKQQERVEIRRKGIPVWTSHPNADVDVAVLSPELYAYKIEPPAFAQIGYLATDKELRFWSLGPGDAVRCLGYPLGAEGEQAGFPILRGGLIASYPILPSLQHPLVQCDFEIYEGNSGGPVYMVESYRPDSNNNIYKGNPVQMILGLVSVQYWSSPNVRPKSEIKLGGYVPAAFIQETIDRYLRDSRIKAVPLH